MSWYWAWKDIYEIDGQKTHSLVEILHTVIS